MPRLVYDTFDRADGALGNADSGQAWTLHTGAQQVITGNEVTLGAQVNGLEVATVDGGEAFTGHGYAEVRLTGSLPAAEKPGLAFRLTDLDNFLGLIALSTGEYALRKWESGEVTVDLATIAVTPATGDRLRAEWNGPQLSLYVNGVLIGTHTSTFNLTATRIGLVSDGLGTEGVTPTSSWDDFSGGTFVEAVSAFGFVGVGIEGTAGTPVDSQVKLDAFSESLNGSGEPIEVNTMNESRMVNKVVQGAYDIGGNIVCSITPDKVTKLIYALLTSLATTGVGDPYTHVFKTGTTLKPLTAQVLRDDSYFIYPGLYIAQMDLQAEIDAVLRGTFALEGRGEEQLYDAEQSDVAVAYSTEDPFVFHQGAVSVFGSSNTDTNNWQIQVRSGLQRRKGQRAARSSNRAYPGKSRITGSFDMVFESRSEHRRWMGASTDTSPVSIAKVVQFGALQLLFTSVVASRVLTIDIPKAYYKASGVAHENDEGMIIQRCEFGAKKDSVTGSDIVLTLLNSEDNAAIITVGTNI